MNGCFWSMLYKILHFWKDFPVCVWKRVPSEANKRKKISGTREILWILSNEFSNFPIAMSDEIQEWQTLVWLTKKIWKWKFKFSFHLSRILCKWKQKSCSPFSIMKMKLKQVKTSSLYLLTLCWWNISAGTRNDNQCCFIRAASSGIDTGNKSRKKGNVGRCQMYQKQRKK